MRTTTLSAASAICLGLTLAAPLSAASAEGAPESLAPLHAASSTRIDGSYIVMLRDQQGLAAADIKAAVSAATDRAAASGARIERRYHALGGYAARMTPAQVEKVRQDPAVAYVEEDQVMRIADEGDATAQQSNATWGIDRVDQRSLPLDRGFYVNGTGAGVKVYIIDTGLNASHQDFSGRVLPGASAINDGRGTGDGNGHGTHVAGSAVGTTFGVAKRASVVPVRVLGADGSGSNSGVVAGMDWVAKRADGRSVANMSLGGGASQATDDAVARMTSAGITVAVAAGNDNDDACRYSPARAASAVTVASSTRSDSRSSFSNYGSCTDIFAPGSDITSAWIGSSTATNTISGTSMASPHVAGAAALILERNPGASASAVASALARNATPNVISGAQGSPNRLLYVD